MGEGLRDGSAAPDDAFVVSDPFSKASLGANLKDEIRQRLEFIEGDCDTFLSVKAGAPMALKGGGNFLMAIGLFSLINFLAKVNRHLTKPDTFITNDLVDEVKDAKKRIKQTSGLSQELKKVVTGWMRPPRAGDTNELEAFQDLIEALRSNNIDIGIPDKDTAKLLWNTFRNPLAHMAWVRGGGVAAYAVCDLAGLTFEEAQKVVRRGKPSFFKRSEDIWVGNSDKLRLHLEEITIWVCNSDRLRLDLEEITNWLFTKIDETEMGAILGTLEWVKDQEKS